MPKTKKRPLNMERDGSIFKAKHYVLALAHCNQMEPDAIKQGKAYSDITIRNVKLIMDTLYPNSTSLSSFKTYMNVGATNDACRGRWKKYIKNGQLDKIRKVFGR